MNPSAPNPPQDPSAPRYWRGLAEPAGTLTPREWQEREFPPGASEWPEELSRRDFLKLMSASSLLAGFGLHGWRRPEEIIYPFGKMPENYVHGMPQYFATAMPVRGTAWPLLVRSHEGRPVKIEGNPEHPDSNGGTDVFAQASILGLYDPDRAHRYLHQGQMVTKATALEFLAQLARKHLANGGQGLCLLLEQSSSPSRARLLAELARRMPKARLWIHEPVDHDMHRRAASAFLEQPVQPYYRLDQAKVLVALDCDFLGTEEEAARYARDFAKGRRLRQPGESMSRLYAIEALLTLTGISADHRLRVAPSQVLAVAAALAAAVSPEFAELAKRFPLPASVKPEWVTECAKDLRAHAGACLVLAGHRQPMAVHLLVHWLNAALGNWGRSVFFHPAAPDQAPNFNLPPAGPDGGGLETLVILGGNPAYNLGGVVPSPLALLKSAKTVVRLGDYEDETAALAQWHLPAAHYLESWGDARTADGSHATVQPLIQPLFDGLTTLEVLARLSGLDPHDPYAIVRETLQQRVGAGAFEEQWKRCVHDGFLAGSAAQPVTPPPPSVPKIVALVEALTRLMPAPKAPPGPENLEVVFHRDYSVDDGRYANNGWLQEWPDPVTKLTWDNAVLISRQTAAQLGVKNNEIVEIELHQRRVRGPIWIQPGQADHTLGLALGYGREQAGRIGNFNGGRVGFNFYPLRRAWFTEALHPTLAAHWAGEPRSAAGAAGSEPILQGERGQTAVAPALPGFAVGATVRRLVPANGGPPPSYPLACDQHHWAMEGRPIIREATWRQFQEQPHFARRMDAEHPPMDLDAQGRPQSFYPNPLEALKAKAPHQWGMSIDLNTCTGCGACVIACQSENNTPIVGKEQVRRGREMHWLRLDRYYTGEPARQQNSKHTHRVDELQAEESWIDDPQVVVQPMLCQHCEAAPCENVCPVNATAHDDEGLNVMAYQRCVGTRYCANNCPYKVRRFNFFDYNKRPLEKLYHGPLASRRPDEWDLLQMVRNPDVTVRMRGVMEKCTFCIQRIEQAKIAQKIKAGPSPNVTVPDGTIRTACQQACPAQAIVFGNVADPESEVSRQKALARDYSVLDVLNTKPRTTYLARVRNPNPALPDTYERPWSQAEFNAVEGDPLREEHPPTQEH